MTALRPRLVLVPFEYTGGTDWAKRDDLPRFREIEEALLYMQTHPEIHFRDGQPVRLIWVESDRWDFIDEYVKGVGTVEWLQLHRH